MCRENLNTYSTHTENQATTSLQEAVLEGLVEALQQRDNAAARLQQAQQVISLPVLGIPTSPIFRLSTKNRTLRLAFAACTMSKDRYCTSSL